jgi:oxygen-independent coproporphyrinogen-3 oxidase
VKSQSELIAKYNRSAPRYTSYPPVPFWRNTPSVDSWINHLKTQYNPDVGLDLYVHIPYCESLCYYCGCNRTITKNHVVENSFVSLLIKEWALYKQQLGFAPLINSIHFGGGTPTFLSSENLEFILNQLLENAASHFRGSIEIDPRTCKLSHLDVFKKHKIERLSLGIQDFDSGVQKAINRDQSVELVENLVYEIRKRNFESLNFDLIYGLPKQTVETIKYTIDIVSRLKPDLIAFYSYAHLPDRIKNQKLIKTEDLPDPDQKREIYDWGKGQLSKAGYVDIGMDHFGLPESFLSIAKKENRLHRNFMGYVDKKSSILLGLGPTSISDSGLSFAQNAKEIKVYSQLLNEGKLPIAHGHTHSDQDLIVQELILDLMCQHQLNLSNVKEIPYWEDITLELNEFITDGLIEKSGENYILSEMGKIFVRNIAMSFDYHLREQQSKIKFSQTI